MENGLMVENLFRFNKDQVRRYCTRINKIFNGKIIKIYQRCGSFSRDSLGLGEPYLTKKKN